MEIERIKEHGGELRKKTLKCKCDLFSWVVIIMHEMILAHGIDFRMSIIMPYS